MNFYIPSYRLVSLNPQPLPPRYSPVRPSLLNPQPLPPNFLNPQPLPPRWFGLAGS